MPSARPSGMAEAPWRRMCQGASAWVLRVALRPSQALTFAPAFAVASASVLLSGLHVAGRGAFAVSR